MDVGDANKPLNDPGRISIAAYPSGLDNTLMSYWDAFSNLRSSIEHRTFSDCYILGDI